MDVAIRHDKVGKLARVSDRERLERELVIAEKEMAEVLHFVQLFDGKDKLRDLLILVEHTLLPNRIFRLLGPCFLGLVDTHVLVPNLVLNPVDLSKLSHYFADILWLGWLALLPLQLSHLRQRVELTLLH